MGRRSRPKPPPDYTPQRNAARDSTMQTYQQQADAYNAAVADYNQKIANAQNTLANVGEGLRGANISNIWDDPTTADVNENYLMQTNAQGLTYDDRLRNAAHTLRNLQAPEKPVFNPTVTPTVGGVVTLNNLPTLNTLNSTDISGLQNQVGSYRSQIDQLYADRQAEEDRVRGIYGQYLTDTANFDNDIANFGISDLSGINQMQRDLNTMQASQYGQNSVLLDQLDLDGDGVYGNEAQGVQTDFNRWKNRLGDLLRARGEEEARINDFSNQLYADIDAAMGTAGGLGYTQTGEIRALEQLIAQKEREARRFSSELGFDFSGQTAELGVLKDRLAALRAEGAAEQSRVSSFVDQQNQQYQNLFDTAMNTGIYSKAGIDALETQLGALNYGRDNFSGWNYDPTSVGGYYGGLINPQIADLRERRSSALDQIQAGIQGATSGLDAIPLYDEEAIRNMYGQVDAAAAGLNRFSGGRADTMGSEIATQRQAIDSKLQELMAYRQNLEDEAQAMMEQIESADYYSLEDLTDPQARAKQMQSNIDLYKARQAMDEIELIMEQLAGQKQRLELDAANVAARTANAQGQLNMVDGVPQFGSSIIMPQGAQQFYNTFGDDEEEQAYTASRSPFSNSLNAITIGG